MKKFNSCPGCGSVQKDSEVFKCNHCGKVFCEICSAGTDIGIIYDSEKCPNCNCNSTYTRTLGKIE